MADAREEHVWTEHASRDHTKIKAFTQDVYMEKLLKKAEIPIRNVLDIGCGSGLWRNIFKDCFYVGLDQNEKMLEVAQERFPNSYVSLDPKHGWMGIRNFTDTMFVKYNARNSLSGLFYDNWKPDLVWCSAVLQHNRHSPDKDEIVDNVFELLNGRGYWAFTECTFAQNPDNYKHVFLTYSADMTDGWSFTRSGWIKYMNRHGFEIVETARHDYYLFRPAL